jgi:hypothetical protein
VPFFTSGTSHVRRRRPEPVIRGLALQADCLTPARFVEACTVWAGRKDVPIADLLVERGWLSADDRRDVERLLDRKLRKHAGDARASLAEVTSDQVRQSLAGLPDPAPPPCRASAIKKSRLAGRTSSAIPACRREPRPDSPPSPPIRSQGYVGEGE